MPQSHTSVLVVDDERRTCEMVRQALLREGYSVDAASDAQSAMELIEERDYAIAILDFRMPEADGLELFQYLHALQPGAIGLFLTGYPTIDTVYPAIAAGVCRVLAKPISEQELLATVRDCLQGVVD